MNKLKWNYTGGVTSESATCVGKIGYDYGNVTDSFKVLTLTYNGDTMKLFIDGELIEESTKSSAGMSKFSQLFIGADYDNTCWFKGYIPELTFFDNYLTDEDVLTYSNYLSKKWGSTLDVEKPVITSANKLTEFNEVGLVINDLGRVVSWNDNIHQRNMYLLEGTTFGSNNINGKRVCYFDSRTFFTLDKNTDSVYNPDYFSLVYIIKFDDYKNSAYNDGDEAQTILSSTDNDQFRIKKFDSDNYISYRVRDWDGVTYYLDAPEEKILTSDLENRVLGKVSLFINNTRLDKEVDILNDFGVAKFKVEGLLENTTYEGYFAVDDVIDYDSRFTFKTLPKGSKSFKIVAGSCNRTGSNAPTWDKILSESPDLFVHLGDLNYLDLNTNIKQDYAKGLDESMSEKITNLFRNVSVVYQYDNHDSLLPTPDKNNTNWDPFLEFFLQVHPTHTPASSTPEKDGLYYSFNMGRIKCIVSDLRRSRDPQRDEPSSNKSVLGPVQKEWLKNEFLDAKTNPEIEGVLWFNQILWTADRNNPNGDSFESWGASWASYEDERHEIANFLYNNKVKNVAIVSADVHMQAIDDGRNGCYITDENGNPIDPNTIEKEFWIPMMEASPFDQYLDYDGGPFNITDIEGSGGPIGSSENSYGVIEVLDTGNKWIQIKMYTMALINNKWVRNRFYTFNWVVDNGGDMLPPPLDWSDSTLINPNGYVFKNNEWKPIKNRFINVNGEFKQTKMKWKFIKGKWEKVYDINSYNPNSPLTLSTLNSWTVESGNVLDIKGKGFLDVSYPVNFGAYYPLGSNFSDLFENFSYGKSVGEPVYTSIGERKSVKLNDNNYLVLPSEIDSGILSNSFYDRDFFIGVNFYHTKEKNNIIIKNTTNEFSIYIEKTILKIKIGDEILEYDNLLIDGWNKFGINVKVSDSGKYTFLYCNDVKIELLNFVIPYMGGIDTPKPLVLGGGDNIYLADFYYSPRYLTDNQVKRYLEKPTITVVFSDSNERIIIDPKWVTGIKNNKFSLTIPDGIKEGKYKLSVESLEYKSNELPINIMGNKIRETSFKTFFNKPEDLTENFYIMHKAWGGANGGVVKENVVFTPGKLMLYGNGDLYNGNIQGVNRDGDPKFHTNEADPNYGKPWVNRVGATLIFKEKTGFGSYRVRCTIPTKLGMCSAFWTFHYNEIYPGDPKWDEFINEGLHMQGNEEDGYYMTRNHEIDIEFPSHLDDGELNKPSFNNMKCNTWRGELKNWDVPTDDPRYWEEYNDNLTETGLNIYDKVEREYRFDWYEDRVEFYIDGVLKRVNTGDTIPDIAGHFTFGVWFPSSPLKDKPWLVNPDKSWAGGEVDSDGGMKAMFERESMNVSSFEFIPFDTHNLRVVGETYPFGTYRKYE